MSGTCIDSLRPENNHTCMFLKLGAKEKATQTGVLSP